MMDDSEAQMETDVSSTTTDIPEAQEITGSNSNAETIVVVEKIKDEEDTFYSSEENLKSDDARIIHIPPMNSSEETSKMDITLPQIEKPSSQTLITDSFQKSKDIAEVKDIEVASVASTIITPIQPEQSLTPTSKMSHIKTVTSSMHVELLVVADSSSKMSPNLEDDTRNNTENTVHSEQYESQSDHQYTAKNHPESMELSDQPVIDVMDNNSLSTELSTTIGNEEDIDKLIHKEKKTKNLIPMDTQKKITSDSQTEISSETTEKEHNKSISRELKSLINSAKESKIISECTQLTSKTRKSRAALDSANTSLNSEAEKIQGSRRSSNNSQKSSCSEKSDKTIIKRSMRSQNPEFVNKVKQFLNSVTGKGQKNDSDALLSDEEMDESKGKENDATSTPKKRKIIIDEADDKTNKLRSDLYCWRCHWAVEQAANEKSHHPMLCTVCPRSFHFKCLSGTERAKINIDKSWVCPECLSILHAESSETRSTAMKKIPLGTLCELLKYALERMMDLNGVEPFVQPVDRTAFPDYDKYVVHPMDLTLMKSNINESIYGSTEAFLADAQWILHNSIIFNTLQSKLTGGARALVRSCRTEMGEIEACPECYAAAHARRPTWFTDVCSTPHILLWAKLKGFPHWPAKGMSVNNSGLVDVRFFGAHDRAWVPAKDCYLYSEKDPNNFRTKRQDILDSMQEAEQHIRNISRKYGKFVYPPFKTQFDTSKVTEQLKLMIPSFEGEVRMPTKEKSGATPQTAKDKSKLSSKSSKSSLLDGDTSEGDEIVVTPTRKMADGAEIAKEEEDYSINDKYKSKPINIDEQKSETLRKRRRSELEEAVITILDCSSTAPSEKRNRCDDANGEKEEKKINEEENDNDIQEKEVLPEKIETTVKIDNEPLNNTHENKEVVESTTPKILSKVKLPKTSTPKEKENIKGDVNDEGFLTPRQGPSRLDKSNTLDKEEKPKTPKKWNSKNKYLNVHAEKSVKNGEKTYDKSVEVINLKEKKENNRNKDSESDKVITKKNVPVKTTGENQKSTKDRKKFDDDTSLAVIARVGKSNVINNNVSCLPTISSVRSLSVIPSTECSPPKVTDSVELTIEETSVSSIFTPTSTDNVRNMKEAMSKLKKLRNETDSPHVGRVGVRSFARMSSPEIVSKDKELMRVEIKTEPVDLDDADRHNEKMDLMNAFKLRPVNPVINNNSREMRINKMVVSPINARKNTQKQSEIRIKAKKTFPQPKKADEGRSELNGKNSMVYIPIQPPITQAPIRGVRPIAINASNPRLPASVMTTLACCIDTVSAPLVPHTATSVMPSVSLATTNTCNVLSTVPVAHMSTTGQIPTVRQTSVQSMPFLTSLNGQWTFSLQPVMSVGGVDESPMPVINGVAERGNTGSILPMANQSTQISSLQSPSALNSIALAAPSPVPTSANSTQTNKNDTPAELPRLQQRPSLLNPLDANTPMSGVPPPSTAGPLTARLNKNAVKLTDFFRTLLEDSLEKIDEPIAQLTSAKLQLEQAKWLHQQEINEIKHNHELIVAEMRASFEKEKVRAVNEAWRSAQAELDVAVKQAKSKQWCANCNQEAQFYCCWNTSYCDYPCQRAHWSKHFSMCTQKRQDNESADGGAPPLDNARHAKDNLPKSTQAPTLAVGNQLNPVRVLSQEQPAGAKSSIIVSMVEDSSGNQTMKCVGTFKPPQPSTLTPININKQIMNKEEAAKKVVTSGGYLIVGGGSTNTTSLTTQRRPPTIQYFT